MKKLPFVVILVFGLAWSTPALAQDMRGNRMDNGTVSDGHTAREEAEGKVVWEKLQTKQVSCQDLTTDDFGVLGEYFMGQRIGAAHEAMNNMMIGMMGEESEEQMHVAMGQHLSGCDSAAIFPSPGADFMPIMNMMMGAGNNFPMNFGPMPFGGFNWILTILWWGLGILGLMTLVKWIMVKSRRSRNEE